MTMNKILLSIIIPSFDGEKHLNNFSLPLFDNVEIIFVNDGSKDNSLQILTDWESNGFIKLLNIEHNGVSFARNIGLSNASGDYVWFADVDDCIIDLDKLLEKLSMASFDIGVFGAKVVNHNNSFNLMDIIPNEKVYTKNCINAFFYEPHAKPYVWNSVYKRSFLLKNEISFNKKLTIGEDIAFQFKAFANAENVVFMQEQFYVYNYLHKDSTMLQVLNDQKRRLLHHIDVVDTILTENFWEIIKVTDMFDLWLLDYILNDLLFFYKTKKIDLINPFIKVLKKHNYKIKLFRDDIKLNLKYNVFNNYLLYKFFILKNK